MNISVKRVAIVVLSIYTLVTLYSGYSLLNKPLFSSLSKVPTTEFISTSDSDADWNPWGEELENLVVKKFSNVKVSSPKIKNKSEEITVEIWGKAAIGLYLWEHILNGKLENKLGGLWQYGFKKVDNFKFNFRTGPGIVPTKVPLNTKYLIITLNGRSEEKVSFAKMWLESLPILTELKKAAVVLLGSEQCHNEWLDQYMVYNGGIVNIVFLVYDSPRIDNKYFFQWPLGVATYRNFPKVTPTELQLTSQRPYMCNFVGTVYKNSSREQLYNILLDNHLNKTCFLKPRFIWQEKETEESSQIYLNSLLHSDLTLSPVGQNTECYRIYEALSFGSVPIVEEVMTSGVCGNNPDISYLKSAPLRILKEYNAPVIFVKNWTNLMNILKVEKKRSLEEIVSRRKFIVQWYKDFKKKLRDKFITILKEHFHASQ